MTPSPHDPEVSLTRLHAALVMIGDGLVRGSASDLLAAEAELSALVRDLPALVESVRLTRDRTAFAPLVLATRAALIRARALGKNVELSFREAAELGGRATAYGPAGHTADITPQGMLDTRG